MPTFTRCALPAASGHFDLTAKIPSSQITFPINNKSPVQKDFKYCCILKELLRHGFCILSWNSFTLTTIQSAKNDTKILAGKTKDGT